MAVKFLKSAKSAPVLWSKRWRSCSEISPSCPDLADQSSPLCSIGIGTIFGLFGLFFSAALLVVIFTLVRSLYLREVLGEDIPTSVHRTLLGPDQTPHPPADEL